MRGFRPDLLAFTFFFCGIRVCAFCFSLEVNSNLGKIYLPMYKDNIEKFAKKDYTEVVAQEKTLEMFSNLFEFEFGKID